MEMKKNAPASGPYDVEVVFIDGTHLIVYKQVDDDSAVEKFNEYVRGLGARVGTTRQVIIRNGSTTHLKWVYGKGEIFE